MNYNYSVRNINIDRVQQVKDLGIILTPSLNYQAHVLDLCCRANRTPGFIFRFSKQLSGSEALKSLYCALVRQTLEYGSPIWSPHQKLLINELEKIQRRFVRMVGFKMGFPYLQVPIETISLALGLQSLEERRLIADTVLLHKIINGRVDCPDMLRQIHFKTPSNTRSTDLFIKQQHRTSYSANSTMVRVQGAGNKVTRHVDFFQDSVNILKKKIISLSQS
ncbi:uncharacterized protein LOC128997375 [Macrosteles quadrilineatus]|uniref:uncharacterized protein LOC128997375 n=1 Tax=Macrosteles quadrilineatus TaxID=74068 RepID=UPI0023E2F5B9|nr:uncharacterized protein LOC128997375 [Macrosteles quadrilineatus]